MSRRSSRVRDLGRKVESGARRLGIRAAARLRRRRVVLYYRSEPFDRKIRAFADLLQQRGFATRVRSGLSSTTRDYLTASDDLWIGVWNDVPRELLPRRYIAVNAEPINLQRPLRDIATALEMMKGAREVWGYLRSNAAQVEPLGVPFCFVPFGYAPYYEASFRAHTAGKVLPQDIDVLFFGALCERRQRILDEIERRGMKVHVLGASNPAYGAKLDELLVRSKIVLGIHYYDEPLAQIADLARLDHLLSNRVFVIHEKPSALVTDAEFEQNVTTAPYDELPALCAHYVADPGERARKAESAHAWFKATYAIDAFLPYPRVEALLGEA